MSKISHSGPEPSAAASEVTVDSPEQWLTRPLVRSTRHGSRHVLRPVRKVGHPRRSVRKTRREEPLEGSLASHFAYICSARVSICVQQGHRVSSCLAFRTYSLVSAGAALSQKAVNVARLHHSPVATLSSSLFTPASVRDDRASCRA